MKDKHQKDDLGEKLETKTSSTGLLGVGVYIYRWPTPTYNHTNRPESHKDTIHSQYTFYSTNFQIEKPQHRISQGHEERKWDAEAAYTTKRVNFALWNFHGNDNVVMRKLK